MWSKVIENLSSILGTDLVEDPYALDLGVFKARKVVDRDKQTRLNLFADRVQLAFRYIQLKYQVPFLKHVTGRSTLGLENSFKVFDEVASTQSTKIIIDSSKSYLRAVGQYKLFPEQVRIVILVRDGRGVFSSGLSHGYSKRKSVTNWKYVYSRGVPIIKKLVAKEHIKVVRYEELVENSESVLKELCQFLEIEYEEGMLQFSALDSHIVNGNDMRFITGSGLKLDERWRTLLSKEDLNYFDDLAGDLNRSFGYD